MYKALDLSRPEIRLLHIASSPEASPIEASTALIFLPFAAVDRNGERATAHEQRVSTTNVCEPYEALSYEWGDPNSPRHTILLDGQPFKVRKNLFRALECLRDTEVPGALWIDAICINQEDLQERNHQVQMMSRIYRSAQGVRVWLGANVPYFYGLSRLVHGLHASERVQCKLRRTDRVGYPFIFHEDQTPDDSERTRRLWKHLSHVYKYFEGQEYPVASPRELIKAFVGLLARSFWSRVWIVQEYLLAQKVITFCGRNIMLDRDLEAAARLCAREDINIECILGIQGIRSDTKRSAAFRLISMRHSRSAPTSTSLLELQHSPLGLPRLP